MVGTGLAAKFARSMDSTGTHLGAFGTRGSFGRNAR